MAVLGQTDMDDLRCVYCRSPAETWDHLVGLVKDSELNGYGHQIGNLVPSCGRCNSLKGNKNWRDFVSSAVSDPVECEGIVQMLTEYLDTFAGEINLERTQREHPAEWRRYNEIKQQIVTLMAEADELAATLRLGRPS